MSTPLTPELIEAAYREGFFPMADDDGAIRWFRPDPRTIIPLEAFHVPRRLARTLRRKEFTLTVDRDFEGVIRGGSGREETWISPEIIEVYGEMHRLGTAHSVEAWRGGSTGFHWARHSWGSRCSRVNRPPRAPAWRTWSVI